MEKLNRKVGLKVYHNWQRHQMINTIKNACHSRRQHGKRLWLGGGVKGKTGERGGIPVVQPLPLHLLLLQQLRMLFSYTKLSACHESFLLKLDSFTPILAENGQICS